MRSNLIILLRCYFLKQSGLNTMRYEKDRKKKNRLTAMTVLMVFVGLMILGYSFAVAMGLGFMGMAEVIPGFSLAITSLITLFFTLFKTNGVMFASHDYNMLMALPIDTKVIITAKFLSMYLSDLLFTLMVMAPMGVAYAIWGQFTEVSTMIWLIAMLLAPLLPMTIAAVIGMGIAAIGSGFKHKVLVQIILSIALIAALLSVSFWFQANAGRDEDAFVAMLSDMSRTISAGIHTIYPPSSWFDAAMNDNGILYFLLFLGVSSVLYLLFVLICGRSYRKINTALMSHHASSNYKVGELKVSSVMMSLLKKEAKRFFSSVAYVTNCSVGIIFTLLLAGACLVIGVDTLFGMVGLDQIPDMMDNILYAFPFAIAMLVNMTCTSCISLSLEGKSLWLINSLPVTSQTVLKAKMLFNIILVLPASLICSVIMIILLKVSAIQALLYIVVAVITVLFSTVLGTWANIHFPNYEWENEIEVIKQGAAMAVSIFSSMIGYTIVAVGVFCLCMIIPGWLAVMVFCVLLGIATVLLYKVDMRCRLKTN